MTFKFPGAVPPVDQGIALHTLIDIVNKVDGVAYSITLMVHGAEVLGSLIGDAEYFRLHGEQWARMYGPESEFGRSQQQRIADIGVRLQADYRQPLKATHGLAPQFAQSPEYEYVNLKDAEVLGGRNAGRLWRVRLTAVDGFSLNY